MNRIFNLSLHKIVARFVNQSLFIGKKKLNPKIIFFFLEFINNDFVIFAFF